MGAAQDAAERQISGMVMRALLSYVERAAGPDAARRIVEQTGLVDEVADNASSNAWFTVEEVVRLAAAASAVCGDDDMGRRTGEEQIRVLFEWGMGDLLVSTGSLRGAFDVALVAGMKMSMGRTFRIVDEGESHLIVEADTLERVVNHSYFCAYTAAVFTGLPPLFGKNGRTIEETCQVRGDDLCRFRISWTDDVRATPMIDADASAARVEERISSFEEVQAMAADLLGTESLDEVLERITDRAAMALEAPRFLLAVRVGETERVRIHQRGFVDDATATAHAQLLLDGATTIPHASIAVTPVASNQRTFGVLAALSIAGAEFSTTELRILNAYAAHASSALEMVATLDGAKRDRDTARALLSLAGELAAVGTTEEVADRLAAAIPTITRCDIGLLWGWDAADDALRLDAFVDVAGGEWLGPRRLPRSENPAIDDLHAEQDPVLLRVDEAPEAVRWIFDWFALERLATIPLVAHGAFLGVLTTGFRTAIPDDDVPQLITALRGFGDHAATALENAKLLADIRHQAMHDALTDLPNRPLVEDRANQVLAASTRTGAPVSVLFLDLDRFKIVNDTLGHGAGDDLIRQVARRLQRLMRKSDTLARLGGDEFVVLLPDVDVDIALEVGRRIVDALHEPFTLCGREVFISCSIGVACAPRHGATYEELMGHADAAMYEAKAQGRNTLALHSDVATVGRREQLDLESALHRAIAHGQLRVHYQPQVEVATGRMIGVEALVRWQHPELGLIEPGGFLQVAEDSGLIVGIDAYVRRTALAQAARWASAGTHLRMALNLSSRDLHDPGIAERIASEIAAAGVDPALVEIEITDRVVMTERDLPTVLHSLHAIGVRLAIDDFGTGSSVLGRLQRCPIDTLKIDRSFVHEVTAGSPEELVLRALVALGQSLQLEVVAEGVEDPEQHELLRACGCDLAQGYLFGRPMDAEALTALAMPKQLTS